MATDRSDRPERWVEIGRLRGAYGVRGWVHVVADSPDADVLRLTRQWRRIDEHGVPGGELQVEGVRRHGAGWVAKLAGVDGPENADALRGTRIAVARHDFPPLPEGEYYWVDLIGARVVNRSGQCLGVVRGLRSNGVHDLLEVAGEAEGPAMLVPLVAEYVDRVELPQVGEQVGVVRVDWEPAWS